MRNTQNNAQNNALDLDGQYLKSIKLDIPTFNGHLDPHFFLNWVQDIDRYFTWYLLSEPRKVRFATIKLNGQASQYWTNVETLQASRVQQPIETWAAMKDELKGKYVPPSYYARLFRQVIPIQSRKQVN